MSPLTIRNEARMHPVLTLLIGSSLLVGATVAQAAAPLAPKYGRWNITEHDVFAYADRPAQDGRFHAEAQLYSDVGTDFVYSADVSVANYYSYPATGRRNIPWQWPRKRGKAGPWCT